MAGYVQTNLINNEQIKYQGRTSVWSLLPKLIIGTLLLPLYGLGLIFFISAAVVYFTTELAITNKRVIAKFGLIRRETVEMNVARVESMQVEQGILGRVFNFGSILIAGAGNPKAPIPGISNPLEFRKQFFEIQEDGEKPSVAAV